jgi:DNA mismatch endonuclease (patch repair protein)
MAAVKGCATAPERAVADLMRTLRFAFEQNCRDLPGCPDLVARRRRKVIFVHGCFWHLHHCRAGRNAPKTNAAYWQAKRERNRARDARTRAELRRAGWSVLTIWECQIRDAAKLRQRLHEFMRSAASRRC